MQESNRTLLSLIITNQLKLYDEINTNRLNRTFYKAIKVTGEARAQQRIY